MHPFGMIASSPQTRHQNRHQDRDDGDHYYLRQLFVDREFRRRGIATQLLDWMYQHVWTDKKVRLEVLVHNQDAITFYEQYGFNVGCLSMEK